MPYPGVIMVMAKNILTATARNTDIDQGSLNMLWNAILYHHFPIDVEYGVDPQPEAFVVRVLREKESAVLVVVVKKPAEDTSVEREMVTKDLIEYVKDRFDETEFSTIYAIGAIGLSFVAYKIDRSNPLQPHTIFNWTGNVTHASSFGQMEQLATAIDEMVGATRDQQ